MEEHLWSSWFHSIAIDRSQFENMCYDLAGGGLPINHELFVWSQESTYQIWFSLEPLLASCFDGLQTGCNKRHCRDEEVRRGQIWSSLLPEAMLIRLNVSFVHFIADGFCWYLKVWKYDFIYTNLCICLMSLGIYLFLECLCGLCYSYSVFW